MRGSWMAVVVAACTADAVPVVDTAESAEASGLVDAEVTVLDVGAAPAGLCSAGGRTFAFWVNWVDEWALKVNTASWYTSNTTWRSEAARVDTTKGAPFEPHLACATDRVGLV